MQVLFDDKSFLKPDLDDRKYRYIKLPNDLQVLLIHDPTTDKAAASLDVNIGSFEDPEELPGLAHFCEHLLFMGSEKFPNENEYSSYLSKHGGSSNAYTASENTNYYFEINFDSLKQALDRFSGFFTCPLFNDASTDKEINAVDSENKKNLQNDIWRSYQLDKSISNYNHPYHKFSTGNLTTLQTLPKENKINIRDELLKFYNKSYSANLMHLVILGREDLDTLANWATDLFSNVKNINRTKPSYSHQVLLNDQHLMKLINVKPVKDLKKLEISFKVPDMDKFWESNPSHYLSHLIGHEGNGSLLAFLKLKGWANELSAGRQTISKDNSFFVISIDLTQDGLNNKDSVIQIIFQYIKMLNDNLPKDYIFHELKDISRAKFKFKQKASASNTVSSLANTLSKDYYPVDKILATSLVTKYEPDLVLQFVKSLTMQNSRIMLFGKDLDTDSIEHWYGTNYKINNYSSDLIKLINDNTNLSSNDIDMLHLPNVNEFIATNFQVDKLNNDKLPLEEPLLLINNQISKLWYKKDDRFGQPRAFIDISFHLPNTRSNLLNSMLTTLYVQLVNDFLKNLQYDASCANLHLSFSKTNQGLNLTLHGFNEKLTTLLSKFFSGIKDFKPTEEKFKLMKDKATQSLINYQYEVPFQQISNTFNALMNDKSWTVAEKLSVIEKIKFVDLINFVPTIYQQPFFESLVHGNLEYVDAMQVDKLINKIIFNNTIGNNSDTTESTDSEIALDSQYLNNKLRSFILPKGSKHRYETKLKDVANVNSCIQYIIQVDNYSDEKSAQSGLFAQMIHEPCFDTLRTKEQLGYVVFSSSFNTVCSSNLKITVQSEHSTEFLEWRIDEFLKNFGERLNAMDDVDFNKHKLSLCKNLLQKYKNMNEESYRYTSSIYMGDYNFTHNQKKAAFVEKITKQEMIEFFNKYVINNDTNTKLIIHLKSQTMNQSVNEDELDKVTYPSGEKIDDIGKFKSSLFLGPTRQSCKKFPIYKPNL